MKHGVFVMGWLLAGLLLGGLALRAAEAPHTEYGNLLEASNSANWGGGKYVGAKYAVSFLVHKGGELQAFWTHWRTPAPGYGGGDLGTWNFELHTDNPTGHVPSDTILSKVTGFTHPPEGYFRIALPKVKLEAGAIYHMVMYNTDPDARTNWSSPNMIRSRIETPWQQVVAQSLTGDNTWAPVRTADAQQLTLYGGYARASYLLEYADGTSEGQPYYSARFLPIFATTFVGEQLMWKARPDTKIVELGFPVFAVGTPADALYYTLEDWDGNKLATGKLAGPDTIKPTPEWYRAKLDPPVTLQQGKYYRLYLSAPGCKDEKNGYGVYAPYSSTKVPGWPELTWGGWGGRETTGKDGKWTPSADATPMDLSFSLLGDEVTGEK